MTRLMHWNDDPAYEEIQMSNEMIEQVALALHNFNIANNPNIVFKNMPDDYQDTWRRLAKAAIAAMREPTDEMIKEGDDYQGFPTFDGYSNIWKRMIDAALKE